MTHRPPLPSALQPAHIRIQGLDAAQTPMDLPAVFDPRTLQLSAMVPAGLTIGPYAVSASFNGQQFSGAPSNGTASLLVGSLTVAMADSALSFANASVLQLTVQLEGAPVPPDGLRTLLQARGVPLVDGGWEECWGLESGVDFVMEPDELWWGPCALPGCDSGRAQGVQLEEQTVTVAWADEQYEDRCALVVSLAEVGGGAVRDPLRWQTLLSPGPRPPTFVTVFPGVTAYRGQAGVQVPVTLLPGGPPLLTDAGLTYSLVAAKDGPALPVGLISTDQLQGVLQWKAGPDGNRSLAAMGPPSGPVQSVQLDLNWTGVAEGAAFTVELLLQPLWNAEVLEFQWSDPSLSVLALLAWASVCAGRGLRQMAVEEVFVLGRGVRAVMESESKTASFVTHLPRAAKLSKPCQPSSCRLE